MEIKIVSKSELVSEIKIKIDAKEWQNAIEKVYEKAKGKYEIQGWRKGKVPRRVIEQNYGNTVFWEDAITEVSNEGYHQAISENKTFDPIGSPNLNVDKVDDNGMEVTITTDVIPAIKLAKYKGLTIKAPIKQFEDKMVDEELKHAQSHKTIDKPQADKVAGNGDIVVLDFVGSVDGVEFEGGKAENHKLELGSNSFVEGFEEQLVGHKAGDKTEVKITFPKEYGAKALAGKDALFKCEIKSVNVKSVPELNDDFAKTMGEYKNFAEYRADVEAQIKHELEEVNKNAEDDAILNDIVTNSVVTLPPVLIEQNLENIMKDLEYRLAYQGINLEDYAKYTNTTVDKLKAERQKDAESLTKTKLVLEALVRAENLMVEEAEVEARLAEISKIQNKTLEEVKKTFDNHRMDHLYSDILMKKLTNFLKANNTIVAKDGEKATAKTVKTTTEKTAKTVAEKDSKKTVVKKTVKSDEHTHHEGCSCCEHHHEEAKPKGKKTSK